MLPNELTLLKRTNFEMGYFYLTACPEMPKEDEAEGVCRELLVSNKQLVEEMLRTPPFITYPPAAAAAAAASTTTTTTIVGGEGGGSGSGRTS